VSGSTASDSPVHEHGMTGTRGEVVVSLKDAVKHFPITQGIIRQKAIGAVRAVDGVSFDLGRGETLGLVGESGCGKSTLSRVIMGLIPATSGSVRLLGQELVGMSERELRRMRRNVQIIFQDPYASLDPRMTVSQIVDEPLRIHGVGNGAERQKRVAELLDVVGLRKEYADRYPHEFSGGQRQRIGIARALALNPRFIVCDEPVSALDVSIQAQIVNLMSDLQQEFGLTYLFIAHDLAVVKHVADRVAVMYLGRIVELVDKRSLYESPQHPYTQALLAAVPRPNPAARQALIPLKGEIPSPSSPPSGCHFHTRCPHVQARCRTETPPLREVAPAHYAACHLI
jgi:oligopeptide transport system ATP-binding protein